MNYLPTCTSRLVVQHPCQVSFKSMQGCRWSWEDKLWCDGRTEGRKDGMTEWRTKQTLNAPLPFYGGGIKMSERETRGVTIYRYIAIHKKFISHRNTKCVSQYIATFPFSISTAPFSFISSLIAVGSPEEACLRHLYPYQRSSNRHMCMCMILILVRKVKNKGKYWEIKVACTSGRNCLYSLVNYF